MRKIIAILILALPSMAHAGGFEILEQSPAGVGTAGAQSAVTDDPGAVFYNPARMTFEKGLGMLGAINVINADTRATPPSGSNLGTKQESTITSVAPTLYAVQRIGSRFAIGLGGFSNMDEIQRWPNNPDFGGRYIGYRIYLTTITLNPSVAFRPLPWLSLGFGLDVVPATFEIRRALYFGGADGDLHASGYATGVGGNLGLFIRAVPKYLAFAFTYRSAMDLDFDGHASLVVPPELQSMVAGYQNAKVSGLRLPHNFTLGVGTHPVKGLSIDFDAHITMWEDLQKLTLTLTDPNAPAGTMPTVQSQPLDFHLSYTFRLGIEYRALGEKLRFRLGGGYDRTPIPASTLGPLGPDADRGLFSFGLGYHTGWFGIDAGYLLVILVDRHSKEPTYPAEFDSMGHVFSIGVTLRFDEFGGRINEPEFKD